MNAHLGGHVVLITGAAGRIGSATARMLGAQGSHLIISDINEKALEQLGQELQESFGNDVAIIPADASSTAGIRELLSSAIECHPRVHAAVHSAYPRSQNWGARIEDVEEASLSQDLSMQMGGAILFSKAMMKHFQKHGGGNLVHVSSIQGISAPKFDHYADTSMHSPIEYAAIKAGVISITRWLAKYYSNQNIRVNCVSPGGISEDQPESFVKRYFESCTNIGMLSAEQVAGSICFLLSSQSVAINGQNLIVDDGWSL